MIKQSIAKKLPVLMQDSSGVPVTGLAFGDVSVKYAKEGETSLTTKTLAADPVEWFEIGQGLYDILFTNTELNTIGFFKYVVTGGAALQYSGLMQISASLVDDVKTDTVSIEGKVDDNYDRIDDVIESLDTYFPIVLADTNAILIDTNETQGKLPDNNIMGSSVTTDKDDEIDAILVDTSEMQSLLPSTTIASEANATTNKNTIITEVEKQSEIRRTQES